MSPITTWRPNPQRLHNLHQSIDAAKEEHELSLHSQTRTQKTQLLLLILQSHFRFRQLQAAHRFQIHMVVMFHLIQTSRTVRATLLPVPAFPLPDDSRDGENAPSRTKEARSSDSKKTMVLRQTTIRKIHPTPNKNNVKLGFSPILDLVIFLTHVVDQT